MAAAALLLLLLLPSLLPYIRMKKQLIIFRQININTSVITVKGGGGTKISENDFRISNKCE
jgi:hypothetical protein